MHFGIDYGSKLAGTTVITYDVKGKLYQISSEKKQDADQLILDSVEELCPAYVFIDAPLSLPGAYYENGEDYFYREGDKKLKAMSPMFLGGLTARAMKLKHQLNKKNIEVFETYPGALVRSIPNLERVYDKKAQAVTTELYEAIKSLLNENSINERPENVHQVDSLIAWYSGDRHLKGLSEVVGDLDEGVIIF